MALHLLLLGGRRLAIGEGILTSRAVIGDPGDPTPDDEIMSLAPPAVTAAADGANAIRVDWTDVLYAGSYEVRDAATGIVVVVAAPVSERLVTGLVADGRTYTYQVRAVARDGVTKGGWGTANGVVLGTVPDPDPVELGPIEPTPGVLARPTKQNVGLAGKGITQDMLTPMNPGTYSQNNLVIRRRRIDGDLVITGSNVRVLECDIRGQIRVNGGDTVRVEDSDVTCFIADGASNVGFRRLISRGKLGSDGCQIKSDGGPRAHDILIEQCLITDPIISASSHYDGVQMRGVDNLTIRYCDFDMGTTFSANYNASIFSENANGGNNGLLIEYVWSRAAGYYHFRLYGTNQRVRHCRFYNKGISSPHDALMGNSWALAESVDNLWSDGTVAIPNT